MSTTAGGGDATAPMSPNPEAWDLAEQMLGREDVMRLVLEETLESGRQDNLTESGRTVCGTAKRPLPPLLREFATVTLPTCPRSVGGTWHTHITRDQLLNPENSLPDWANIAFGVIDVSIVVGAETLEVIIGSVDLARMQDELAQVLGVNVASVEDVVEAILDGEVQDPPTARVRLRRQLDPLVFTIDTEFPNLAQEIRTTDAVADLSAAAEAARRFEMVAACPMYAAGRQQRLVNSGPFDQFRWLARRNAEDIIRAAEKTLPPEDVDIRSQAWSTGIGFFVAQMLADLLS